MGGEGDVFFDGEEGVVGGGRFGFEDVESAAGDVAGIDGVFEGCFVDEAAAGAVDDEGAFVHESDALFVHYVAGVISEGDVEGDDIGTGEGDVGGFSECDFEFAGAGFCEEGVVGDDVHVEGLGAFGELGADAAHAEDGEAFAVEFDALEGFARGVEVSGEDSGVGGADVSGGGEHEGERVLGGGDGVAGGRVHDDHAVVGGGVAVDVIDADSGAADGFEVGGG